jgi:hypothetical protein
MKILESEAERYVKGGTTYSCLVGERIIVIARITA